MSRMYTDPIAQDVVYLFILLNLKGGVGKTTVSLALSVELAAQGIDTLLVGFDENPNLADWLKPYLDPAEQRQGLAPDMASWRLLMRPEEAHSGLARPLPLSFDALNPLTGKRRYSEALLAQTWQARGWRDRPARLDFIPDCVELEDIESTLAQQTANQRRGSEFLVEPEHRLAYALRNIHQEYRAIVIDMPPSRTKFVLQNGLRADTYLQRDPNLLVQTHVIVPLDFSMMSVESFMRFRRRTLEVENRRRQDLRSPLLNLLGVLMCRYDEGGEMQEDHDEILRAYRSSLDAPETGDSTGRKLVFEAVIPEDKWVQKATIRRVPPQMLRPISPANEKWPVLAREVMNRARLAQLHA